MTQALLPISTLSNTANVSAVNAASIHEALADASTGNYVAFLPGAAAGENAIVRLTSHDEPDDLSTYSIVVKVIRLNTNSESVRVTLMQDGVQDLSSTTVALSASPGTEQTITLTPTAGELRLIDTANLYAKIEKVGAASVGLRFTVLSGSCGDSTAAAADGVYTVTEADIAYWAPSPNAQQFMNYFRSPVATPPNGKRKVLVWFEGQGFAQNDRLTEITSTNLVLWEALEAGIDVFHATVTYANQPVDGFGKFVPPTGATLTHFLTKANCYRDACLVIQKVRRLILTDPDYAELDSDGIAAGGRSGGAYDSALAGLAIDFNPALNAAYTSGFYGNTSTRPNALVLLSGGDWWPGFDQESGVLPAGFFFHESDTGLTGSPQPTTLADVSIDHQRHASALRFGFDTTTWTALIDANGDHINARIPIFVYAAAPASGLEITNFEGLDGSYNPNDYPEDDLSDPHTSWFAISLWKQITALSSWHEVHSRLALDHVNQYESAKAYASGLKSIQYISATDTLTANEVLSQRAVKFLLQELRGQPVEYQIIEDVQDALESVVAGINYYQTIKKVYRVAQPSSSQVIYPSAFVLPVRTSVDRESRELHDAVVCTLELDVWVSMKGSDTALLDLSQMVADVEKAVMADHTRGDLAVTTRYVEHAIYPPGEELASEAVIQVRFAVEYRTSTRDFAEAV